MSDDLMRYYHREWLKMAANDTKTYAELDKILSRAQLGFACASIACSLGGIVVAAMLGYWGWTIAGILPAIVSLYAVKTFTRDRKECAATWLGYRDFDLRMADKFKSYYER